MRYSSSLPAVLLAFAVALLSGCSSGGDNADASVRLLNVSPGYQALDLYVSEDDADTDALRTSNVVFGALGEYTTVASGTYDIKFKRTGITSTLDAASDEQLADDSHSTYVAFGAVGRFNYFEISEDVEEPEDDGRTRLTAFNASAAGGVDIYLTDPDVALDDASPTFTPDSVSTTTDSGTYRLRVTGPNDTSDLRLDVPSITLDEHTVASLILTETTGGVMVDALLLPQQGTLTTFKNTKARVRAAVGLLPGSTATLRVGGVLILNNQPVGVIGNYAEVEAGNVAVTLGVSGSTIAVDDQTLVAGGDYTMLLWADASGVRASLITDDNHQPTDESDTKIRLLNAWSTQSDPIHFAVAYSPVIEATSVGQSSPYAEVDSGSDFRIDVYNSTTAANVNFRENVDLDADSVYTLLVFADASGNAISALRQDR